jgi:FG-GAP-like repeat
LIVLARKPTGANLACGRGLQWGWDDRPAVGNLTGFSVSVLLGKGDGTFRQAVDYSSASGTTAVLAADLDGDGILDLVASDGIEPEGVSVLKGNGDGSFQPQIFYPAGVESEYVVVGD